MGPAVDDPRKYDSKKPPGWSNRALLAGFALAAILMSVLVLRVVLMPVFVDRVSARYTVDRPQPLPASNLAAHEVEAIEDRIDAFTQLSADAELVGTHSLTLTQNDLNGLLQDNEGELFLRIAKGEITGEVNFRIEDNMVSGAWNALSGRYVHGLATFDIGMRNDRLHLGVTELTIKNRRVPKWIWKKPLSSRLNEMMEDPEYQETVAGIDAVEVVGDAIILTIIGLKPSQTVDASIP